MKATIHLAQDQDSEEIVELQKYTWICTYPNPQEGITKKDIKNKVNTFDSKYWEGINKTKDRRCWVSKIGKEIVGFCVASRGNNINYLRACYVHPDFQRQGIGKELMARALEWLGDDKDIQTEVVAYNTRAINFYKKFGFIDKGFITDEMAVLPSGKSLPEIKMVKTAR